MKQSFNVEDPEEDDKVGRYRLRGTPYYNTR